MVVLGGFGVEGLDDGPGFLLGQVVGGASSADGLLDEPFQLRPEQFLSLGQGRKELHLLVGGGFAVLGLLVPMAVAGGLAVGLGGGTTVGMAVVAGLRVGVPGGDGRVGLVGLDLPAEGLVGEVIEFLTLSMTASGSSRVALISPSRFRQNPVDW